MGMMFQGGALLDSYTVFENVALPLREQRRLSPSAIEAEVHGTLKAVGVGDSDGLLPGELSGGMLRRVAWRGRLLASHWCCYAMSHFRDWTRFPCGAWRRCSCKSTGKMG